VIDYAVTPIVCGQGEDPTWWQIHYGDPDPAFILPWRLDKEKLGSTGPEDNRYQTKELLFVPEQPRPVTRGHRARVHNFSLAYTPDTVAVSFYLGDPDNGGVILTTCTAEQCFLRY